MKRSQGAQANLNGKTFEEMCIPLFEGHGFPIFTNKQCLILERRGLLPDKYVIHQAPYTNIYGSNGKTEFVVVDGERRIRLESKYQVSQGSVDEKYPYMLMNAIFAYPEQEVILIVDGKGYREEARQWIVDKLESNWYNYRELGKSIQLMTIIEFANWFNRNF